MKTGCSTLTIYLRFGAPGQSSSDTAVTSVVTTSVGSTPVQSSSDLATRLKSMEQNVNDLTAKKNMAKVDDALREVRVLASRPKLTQPHVSHKDTEFYSKTLQACRRFDDDSDLCGLCMKLIGSAEDRKVASAVSEWAKGKKYESKTSPAKTEETGVERPDLHTRSFNQGIPFNVPTFPMFSPYQQFGFPGANQVFFGGPTYLRQRSEVIVRMDFGKKDVNLQPEVPTWELDALDFNPNDILLRVLSKEKLFPLHMTALVPRRLLVKDVDFYKLPFLNPSNFVAGNLHNNLDEWKAIEPCNEVMDWLENGVNVHTLNILKDNSRENHMIAENPPLYIFIIPVYFTSFIATTLLERVENCSLLVWGKVGKCEPPYLVLPLTVEPSKPRLCHDERYLNLWIVDKPFKLDTLKDVPRIVDRNTYLTSIDDKSGYEHVRLSGESRKYFGIQFAGWYFVYATLPLGFKLSAYIYHKIGLEATGYCRKLGVPCLQYIDDRLISEWVHKGVCGGSPTLAYKGLYIVCQVLIRLGYFIALTKCNFEPPQILLYLGMLIDSRKLAFILPAQKKERFCCLRENILHRETVDIKTLQRFAGKCVSFVLAVPAARLYSREKFKAVRGKLRQEIEFWKFLDTWEGFIPWKSEKHLQLNLATDSSGYKWGAYLLNDSGDRVR
ncbi:LOW QUALITY PROTEIN: hypothetical protein KUTeg_021921 [Tegillarca granosa]|uniref:Reverse transcriptase domain-containing protein n=1 Tax=Tegillarca granosa TaxID=220873 RepID=A0ABQ9EA35_TEGGR|nr:LOW QUALITY PROTEIN: hypothetical protein KUTeg_021921 [Tegillarca granosa]